jgi:hypothetical protein
MHEPPNATREKREEANLNVKGGDEKFADTAGWRRPAHFPRPLLAYHAGRFPKRVAASRSHSGRRWHGDGESFSGIPSEVELSPFAIGRFGGVRFFGKLKMTEPLGVGMTIARCESET